MAHGNMNDSSIIYSDDDELNHGHNAAMDAASTVDAAGAEIEEDSEMADDSMLTPAIPPSPSGRITRSKVHRNNNVADSGIRPIPKTRKLNTNSITSVHTYQNGHADQGPVTIIMHSTKERCVQLLLHCKSCLTGLTAASSSSKYAVLLSLLFLNTIILAYIVHDLHHVKSEIIHLNYQVQMTKSQQVTPDQLDTKLQLSEQRLASNLEWKLKIQIDSILTQLQKLGDNFGSITKGKSANYQDKQDHRNQVQDTGIVSRVKTAVEGGFLSFLPNLPKFNFERNREQIPIKGIEGDKIEKLKRELETLQSVNFPSQPRETWITIYAAVASTLESSRGSGSERPGIVFILQKESQGLSQFSRCFVKNLAQTINRAITGSSSVKYLDPDQLASFETVTELQQDMESHLANQGKVIVMTDAHLIQREDLLYTFHSFCDNLEAPDPKAIIIFIATIPLNMEPVINHYDWLPDNGNKIVNTFLNHAWKSALSEDKRAALIARVAPSVVLLQTPGQDNGQLCELI